MLPNINGKKFLNLVLNTTRRPGKNNAAVLFNKYYLPSFIWFIGLGSLISYGTYHNTTILQSPSFLLVVLNLFTLGIAVVLFYRFKSLKKSHKALSKRARNSDLRFEKIYGSDMIGLLFTNLDGNVQHANKAFLDMVGYTQEDLDNGLVSWRTLTPPEHADASVNAMKQLQDNGFSTPFEKEYIRKDGSRVNVMIGSSLLGDSDLGEAVTYVVDLTEKKESEKRELKLTRQIDQQKEELMRIFMNAPALITIRRGPELKLVFSNTAASNFAYTSDHIGLNIKETAARFKIEQGAGITQKVYDSGVPYATKAFHVRLDRLGNGQMEDAWFDFVLEPLYDTDGNIDGVVSFGFDVTSLVKANQELQERESKFKFLTDAIPHKLWTSDATGKAIYYNKGWYDYTGTKNYDELHPIVWNLIHPDDLEHVSKVWSDAISAGEEMAVEQRFLRHDGVYQWHLSRFCPHRDDKGNIEMWVGTSTNIHEQKTAQESLKVSEAHFKALTNNRALLIWQIDPACKTTYVNDTWREFTGITANDITEYHWVNNIHPEDRARALDEFNSAFEQRLPIHSKYRFKNVRTGEYRWMLDNAHPVFNPGFNGYIGSMTDIHEQVTAQRATEVLMQKKDEFLGIASHELKTPITSMKASLQVLQRYIENASDTKSKFLIDRANKQVNKLTAIVNDLLDVTKIQSGKMQLNKVEYNFLDSLKECVFEMQQYEPNHQIIIKDDKLTLVTADRERIEQVIVNFLSNAVKYSPGKEMIQVTVEQEGQFLKCSISDSGIGIPEDKQPFIFDRFFRVHESSQMFAGLGLGLFISSEIIKQHQGHIGMLSEEGAGSTFWFTLPLA